MVALDAADPGCAEAVRFLASVVGPGLAASSHEADLIVADAAAGYRTAHARVSELIALRCQDAQLSDAPHVQTIGKGRKQRITMPCR